jgi:hypothetical protein
MAYDSYMGGMNSGPRYSGQPNVKPGDGSQGVPGLTDTPAVGATVKHAKSSEVGTVTGYVSHGQTANALPTVRWKGQPSTGFTSDQGYSLDSLTNP